MHKRILYTIAFLSMTFTELAVAIDKSSTSYQIGSWIGKIFIAVLLILVIKKLFFKKP